MSFLPGEARLLPDKIGPYAVDCLLKSNSMSLLYLATEPKTLQPTAIKVLAPNYLKDERALSSFLTEIEAIELADHPNIIKLYGHGRWEAGVYIAMEFIEGVSLREHLLQKPLSLRQSLSIVIEIIYALCHLHAHGIIHRDLKPENILITAEGSVKVIDFGIAQIINQNSSSALKARWVIGTPFYMSPEQQVNPNQVSFASDLYSLGIITYELLIGRPCFGKIHLSLVPKGLQKLLHKALQPQPEKRYQDVVDFVSDISDYMSSSQIEGDSKLRDRLAHLYSSLEQAGAEFLSPPPVWKEVETAILTNYAPLTCPAFFRFYNDFNGCLLFVSGKAFTTAESSAMFYTAQLRAYCDAALHGSQDSLTYFQTLNRLIRYEKKAVGWGCSFLQIFRDEAKYLYICYGYDFLLHYHCINHTFELIDAGHDLLTADDPFLISERVEGEWERGDILLFCSGRKHRWLEQEKQSFLALIHEPWWRSSFGQKLSLQKKIEAAVRRAKARNPALWQDFGLVGFVRL